MKGILFVKALIFFILVSTAQLAMSQTTNYKAHAVFIFNIAKYSQWPASGQGEFVITVLGKSKIYDELLAGAPRYTINGAKVVVRESEDPNQIAGSQMVVVADNKSNDLSALVKAVSGKATMIITEREGLHKKGADVSFFINDQGKLNFDLNLTEMTKRELSMSKSLTTLAATVL
jgi:hypothetical protein